jgi:hypothetical protein
MRREEMRKPMWMVVGMVLLMLPATSYAEGVISLPSTAADEVVIVNQSRQTLHFSLRAGNGEWINHQLESGELDAYECEGTCEGLYEFFMRTDDERDEKYVHYILEYHERYSLRWNDKEERWDLYRVTEPVRNN